MAKSLERVVGVGSTVVSSGGIVDGSSTSFSGTCIRGRLDEDDECGVFVSAGSLLLFFRLDADEGAVKTDNGREIVEGRAGLIEAWAVLTETDAVAGPEEKIDRCGVLKRGD